MNWTRRKPGSAPLSAPDTIAKALKVEGPQGRTDYSIARFVYCFAFLALSPVAALKHQLDEIKRIRAEMARSSGG